MAQLDLAEMELAELRAQQKISQVDLAARLKTAQGAISRLERRRDMLVSTLGDYVRAIGGRLEVRVVFKDRAISLSHFANNARRKRTAKRRWPSR